MRYLILFITSFLFAFEVEFIQTKQINIFPDKDAILLVTKKPIQIDYEPKFYTKKGIVLLDYDKADQFVRNDLYFDGEVKNVKISTLDIDRIRNEMILKLNKYYKNCKLKKILFDDSTIQKIYFKPTNLSLKANIILECK